MNSKYKSLTLKFTIIITYIPKLIKDIYYTIRFILVIKTSNF